MNDLLSPIRSTPGSGSASAFGAFAPPALTFAAPRGSRQQRQAETPLQTTQTQQQQQPLSPSATNGSLSGQQHAGPYSIHVNVNGLPMAQSYSVQPSASANASGLLSSEQLGGPLSPLRAGESSFAQTSGSGGGGAPSASNLAALQDSFSRSLSPTLLGLSSSFRSARAESSQAAAQAQAKNVSALSDMLAKAREGLHKLQAEVEGERQRRQAAERDLAESKRDLSDARLSNASSSHSAKSWSDKESRLLRELALAKLVESQVRNERMEVEQDARREKEERIRLQERLEAHDHELRAMHAAADSSAAATADLQDRSERERASAAAEIASLRSSLSAAESSLRSKDSALGEALAGMEALGQKLTVLDSEAKVEQTVRNGERMEAARVAQELTEARSEHVRLAAAARESARSMAAGWEAAQRECAAEFESRLGSVNERLSALKSQEHSLASLVHETALRNAALTASLDAKTREAESIREDLTRQRESHAKMHDNFQKHIDEAEAAHQEKVRLAREEAQEQQKRAVEQAVEVMQRDIERAIGAAVNGVDSPSSASVSAGANSSPDRSVHSAALSQCKQHILSKFDSAFHSLHKMRERGEYEAQTAVSLLKQEISFLNSAAAERKASEEDLARRISEISEKTSDDAKKFRGQLAEQEALLNERADVIRELKKRYKREQEGAAAVRAQLATAKSELSDARQIQQADLDHLRRQSSSELTNSLAQAESIAARRLEAENRLRKKAEEESDKYVRACQSSEERVFLLQQEKATLVSFFKQQMATAQSRGLAATSAADWDSRLAEQMRLAAAFAGTDAQLQGSPARPTIAM